MAPWFVIGIFFVCMRLTSTWQTYNGASRSGQYARKEHIGKWLTENVKMPSKRHQNWSPRKIFHRRTQIREFCACKYNHMTSRWLCRFWEICAIFKRRKAAFWAQNVMFCSVVRASRGRDMAAVIMRRRPRCNAIRALLRPRKALTAEPERFSSCILPLPPF